MELLIVADDLTGAADAAVPFSASRETAVLVHPTVAWPPADVLAINTETRYADGLTARKTVGGLVSRAGRNGVRVFKKIDSLLRGNVGVEIAASLEALRLPDLPILAIVAPAFPRTGRTTLNGIVHVAGTPLGSQRRVADVLSGTGLSHALVSTDDWTDPASLAARFQQILSAHIDTAIVDARNDSDLAAIVAAAESFGDQALLVGSGGISAALASSLKSDEPAKRARPIPVKGGHRAGGHSLVVIGSYAPTSRAQLDELVRAGFQHIHLDHTDRLDAGDPSGAMNVGATIATLRDALDRGQAVLTPDLAAALDKKQAKIVAAAIGATAAAAASHASSIVVSGGETAVAVLNHLGVAVLNIRGEILPGIVDAEMPGHIQPFITKSGAFGDVDALTSVVTHIEQPQ
ncbi:four-carbon acid sugar kinase family protein [Arthrobacter sp. NPDC080031]|uniref:four-carbon acid sugar kinase family protein n=1 Tax=Arthrobacter sp. NPDC080031 TaxID=3155918 RepID=UPI00344FBD76